jgi:hypothetical protein
MNIGQYSPISIFHHYHLFNSAIYCKYLEVLVLQLPSGIQCRAERLRRISRLSTRLGQHQSRAPGSTTAVWSCGFDMPFLHGCLVTSSVIWLWKHSFNKLVGFICRCGWRIPVDAASCFPQMNHLPDIFKHKYPFSGNAQGYCQSLWMRKRNVLSVRLPIHRQVPHSRTSCPPQRGGLDGSLLASASSFPLPCKA